MIKSIESSIELHIRMYPKSTIFIVLNRNIINESDWPIYSLCLHLVTKYKQLQWPKVCASSEITPILFIGVI